MCVTAAIVELECLECWFGGGGVGGERDKRTEKRHLNQLAGVRGSAHHKVR